MTKYSILALGISILLSYVNAQNWQINSSTDPFDDTKLSYQLAVNADGAGLAFRCEDGNPSFTFISMEYIGGDSTYITYRFDEREAGNTNLYMVPDGDVGFVDGQIALDLFVEAKAASKFAIRLNRYDNAQITYIFEDISGLTDEGLECFDDGL